MRSIVFSLAFALISVSAVQAQQPVIPAPVSAEQPDLRPAEVPVAPVKADPAPALAETFQARHEVVEAGAVRETSARSLLAIVGAVVVVVALIALLN